MASPAAQQLALPGFGAAQRATKRRRQGMAQAARSWLQLALDFTAAALPRPKPHTPQHTPQHTPAKPAQPPSVFTWMAQQALHAASTTSPPQRPKTRNTGMRKASDTRRVFEMLRAMPERYLLHRQIKKRLGLRKGALDWALHYLRRIGAVEATPFQPPGCRCILRYRMAAR